MSGKLHEQSKTTSIHSANSKTSKATTLGAGAFLTEPGLTRKKPGENRLAKIDGVEDTGKVFLTSGPPGVGELR
jgi:hypothetical protein